MHEDQMDDLHAAMMERYHLHVTEFGPLTREEQALVTSYEEHFLEQEKENEEFMRTGRTVCPKCGERSVKHGSAYTVGWRGHPGAEQSAILECEKCDYKEMA